MEVEVEGCPAVEPVVCVGRQDLLPWTEAGAAENVAVDRVARCGVWVCVLVAASMG